MSDAMLRVATRRAATNEDGTRISVPLATIDRIEADGVKVFYRAAGAADGAAALTGPSGAASGLADVVIGHASLSWKPSLFRKGDHG